MPRRSNKKPRPFPARPRASSLVPRAVVDKGERLQKVMAAAGIGSRRKCEELILEGRVEVDGKTVQELGTRVDPASQDIRFDGEPLGTQEFVYWFVNKPQGYLCTTQDTHNRRTVMDLIPATKQRLYPVGRLDEQSTGLLLLTNDGPLANRLTHPRYGVPKTYRVLAAGKVSVETIIQLRKGIWLSDGPVRVSSIERMGIRGDSTLLRIVLREGHNREIRRMFARFDHKVMKLERIAIGPIKLRKLKVGMSRRATADEVELLQGIVERAQPRPRATREKVEPNPRSTQNRRGKRKGL